MALTVEDGEGLDDANALAALADVEAWLADRGLTGFAALSEAVKNAAIVQATDYLSTAFDWLGDKLTDTQALGLPTDEVAAGEDLPTAILAALSRLAYAVAINSAQLFGTVTSQNAVQRVKAGSVDVEFADSAVRLALQGRPDFPWLFDLIGPYVEDMASPLNREVVRV